MVCGEKGIRTPGTLLRYTRFPGVPVKPLLHLSGKTAQFTKKMMTAASSAHFTAEGLRQQRVQLISPLRDCEAASSAHFTAEGLRQQQVQLISPLRDCDSRVSIFAFGNELPRRIIIFVTAASAVISLPLITPAVRSPAEVSYKPISTLPARH